MQAGCTHRLSPAAVGMVLCYKLLGVSESPRTEAFECKQWPDEHGFTKEAASQTDWTRPGVKIIAVTRISLVPGIVESTRVFFLFRIILKQTYEVGVSFPLFV